MKKRLVKKLEQLWSNAGNTLSSMKNGESTFADPFDRAASESNKYVELACRNRERVLMLDIKETIQRIDQGLYGMCDSCGRTIPARRLQIEPMSRLCAECQEEKETDIRRSNNRWAMKGMSYGHP